MGGKTKQSQRTKNNVRPSSSSRSAELLSGAVTADGGLVNPSTGKVLPALFPTLAAANFEQGLNPEFQMCIKKLNKKDPITKTKALQELCELVNKGNVDDVVAALPSWAHFYKILTVDTDRKVREMTQVCHGAAVRASGRRAAPALRRLLPAWLQAQYDDHAPAAAAAHNSLKSTFPDSKLPEVVSFCKAEVMAHLTENLLGDAEAVINKKSDSAEEKELQLCRVVTSSLQGLQYFVQHLPPAHRAWLWDALAPLLQAPAFWTLAHHASLQLRAAWYGAMGSIIERYKATFGEKYGTKTLRLLLAAAKELNPLVAAQLWACLLVLMHNVEGWHKYLDKKELLIKRILDVLENGGWGDARHLSNMMLPLLANLPREMLTQDFYEAFFKAIYIGLENKKILNSKCERQSWITSLGECLRYLSIQQNDFVVGVATGVHRTWVEKILSVHLEAQTKSNLIKCSSTNMASILKYWLKQSKEENSEKYDQRKYDQRKYDQLVRNFWQNIGSTILAQIDKCGVDHDEIGKLIDAHILQLQSLKTSLTQEAKKQHSIRFDGDQQTVTEENPVAKQQCDASVAERYKHNLDELAQKICSHYFEFASKKEISSPILSPLITLLVEFDGKNLFLALARQFGVDTVYTFYDKVLRTWLAGDTMRCKAAVDIAFLMMKHLSEEEQDMMFNSFSQLPPAVEQWCLAAALAHPARAARAARAWLRGAAAGRAAARACRRALQQPGAACRNLLLMCFTAGDDGEFLISESAVADIVGLLAGAVTEASALGEAEAEAEEDGPALEQSAALAAQLAAALLGRDASPPYTDFLYALFTLNVHVPRGSARLSLDTWREARAAWREGGAALPPAARRALLRRAAALLGARRARLSEDLNIAKLEHMVSLCPHLLSRSADVPHDVTEITEFTRQLFTFEDDSRVITMCAVRHECVTSQLNCLDENDNDAIRTVIEQSSDSDVTELTKEDLMSHINKFLFRAIYLRTMFLHKVSDDDEDDQKCWCDALLGDEYLGRQFCDVVHDYVVLNSLHEGYAFWPHYHIIEEAKQKLDSLLSDVIAAASEATRSKVACTLAQLAREHGYHWALAQAWLQQQQQQQQRQQQQQQRQQQQPQQQQAGAAPPRDPVPHEPSPEEVVSGVGFFHCLQASTRWSPDEDREYETKYLVMLRSLHAAHADALGAAFLQEAAAARRACDLDLLVNAYYRRNDTMLFERDAAGAAWAAVASAAALAECLRAAVQRAGHALPPRHWDFTTIALCSLLSSLDKSKHNWGCTKVALLARAVLRLLAAVQRFVGELPARSLQRQPAPHVAELAAEWRDVFAPDLHVSLFSIATHVLESECPVATMSSPRVRVLAALAGAARRTRWAAPGGRAMPGGAGGAGGAGGPRALQGAVARALARPAHPALKYLAYYVGRLLAEPLVLDDAAQLALWSEQSAAGEDERAPPRLSLDCFADAFAQLRDVVEAALQHVAVGEETCEMVSMSDGHSMALGWLLLAELLSQVSGLARGDLLHHHIRIYRERRFVEPLLGASLRLLPPAVFALAQQQQQQQQRGAAPAPAHLADLFHELPEFSADEPGRDCVGRLACRCVCSSVTGAGAAAARGWWGGGAGAARAGRLLERLVQAHVAPRAARDQLLALQRRAAEIPDCEIRIAWSTSEVSCVYSVEERELELRVLLSRSHPLTAPRLVAPRAAAGIGANTHWLALYLAYQNGTVLNALKMWTKAVNARVESAPQCYICYCRLHPGSGRLPRVPCHQCNNKFHNTCLRKWFTTSNKSSCPLCRSNF